MTNNSRQELSWEASEYYHHDKTIVWYIVYTAIAIFSVSGIFLLTRDIFSAIVILLMLIAVMVYANRKPQKMAYKVDSKGVIINGRGYSYDSFKSFSIMEQGENISIYLEPLERFMPPVSLYFNPQDGEQLIEILGSHLPNRQREPDMIDNLIHKFRL